MQANQGPVIWTVVIVGVVLLLGMFLTQTDVPEPQVIDVPTAAEIASLIVVPAPAVQAQEQLDNSMVARICELTEGCEFWEGSMRWLNSLDTEDAEEDFFDAMVDFTGIDEDYLVVQSAHSVNLKDWQVRAYTEDDKDDENWEIKTFIKVRYYDSDEANSFSHEDAEYAYLVVTSVLDEGDYDELSFEEVSRSFEF